MSNMSHIYSYSSLSSRVKRQKDQEFSLFKMATICGYPGASTRWLPFIHSSFPASPTIPPPKCYTISPRREQTSMSVSKKQADDKSQAIVCYEEKEVIQLPDINHPSDEHRSPTVIDNSYINKNKVCYKLRGINPKQLYCVNRSKPNMSNSHRHGLDCLRINPHRSATLMSFTNSDAWNQAMDSIAKATFLGTSSNQDTDWTQGESGGVSPITLTMGGKYENEERRIVPGMKGRKIQNGRPLGHIVSPRRLNSLLRDKERTLPYTYYKTLPTNGR